MTKTMTWERVAEIVRANVDLQIELDDMVRNKHESLASTVNNGGIENQLKWLEENCHESPEEIINYLEENE